MSIIHHHSPPKQDSPPSAGAGLSYVTYLDADLSLREKPPRRYDGHDVEMTVYHDLTKLKISEGVLPGDLEKPSSTKRRGKKQRIERFSSKSRKAFLEKMAMCRTPMDGGINAAVTYPGLYTSTPEEVKAHLFALRRRFERAFPNAGVFWREEVEPRKSGASEGELVPHFHFLIFGLKVTLRWFRRWLALAWNAIVAPGDTDHLKACAYAEHIRSRRHAMYYASKYVAKPDSLLQLESCYTHWGRWWGCFGNLDFTPYAIMRVNPRNVKHIRRAAARLLKSRGTAYGRRVARGYQWHGWSMFGVGARSSPRWASLMDATVMRIVLAATDV